MGSEAHATPARRRLAALAVFVLAGLLGGGCSGADNAQGRNDAAVKKTLDAMLRDSRQYYVPEGLPGRLALLDQLPKEPSKLWKKLTPIQAFFVFEVAPDYLATAPLTVAQNAYCAALESLPGEWFTPYRSLTTATSKRLMSIDGIDACLLRQLDNHKLVEFGDSEPHANASLAQYQVADLAALFLCARNGLDYDINAPLERRTARREELKALLRNRG